MSSSSSSSTSTSTGAEKRKSDEFEEDAKERIEKKLKTEHNKSIPSIDGEKITDFGQVGQSKGLLSIKLNSLNKTKKDDKFNNVESKLVKTDRKLKAIFNDEDDSNDGLSEMPAEAKMKMRNIGRDTPTSSGPNSFSKGKHGFLDIRKAHEKHLDNLTKRLDDS